MQIEDWLAWPTVDYNGIKKTEEMKPLLLTMASHSETCQDLSHPAASIRISEWGRAIFPYCRTCRDQSELHTHEVPHSRSMSGLVPVRALTTPPPKPCSFSISQNSTRTQRAFCQGRVTIRCLSALQSRTMLCSLKLSMISLSPESDFIY